MTTAMTFIWFKSVLCRKSDQWRIRKSWKGSASGRQCIGPFIYRKCTQWTICVLFGKRWLTEKSLRPRIVRPPPPPPSPLWIRHWIWCHPQCIDSCSCRLLSVCCVACYGE